MSDVDEIVALDPRRGAGSAADGHGLRPRLHRLRTRARRRSLPAQGAGRDPADGGAVRERRRRCSSSFPSSTSASAGDRRARFFPGRTRSSCRTRRSRFAWLTGGRPESIGVRVPVLTGADGRDRRAPRGRRRDEREPARRATILGRSPTCRPRSSAGVVGCARRGRAAGRPVDRDRRHRCRARDRRWRGRRSAIRAAARASRSGSSD